MSALLGGILDRASRLKGRVEEKRLEQLLRRLELRPDAEIGGAFQHLAGIEDAP